MRFAGLIHPGLIGTAPSHQLLDILTSRGSALDAPRPHEQQCSALVALHKTEVSVLPSAYVGVRFAGLIHPGLIGTAPSQQLLDIWNQREAALVEAGPEATTLGGVLHTRPLGERGFLCNCFSTVDSIFDLDIVRLIR